MLRFLIALCLVVALTGAACGGDDGRTIIDSEPVETSQPTGASVDPASLEGRTFVSTSVTEDGADRPLVDGTDIQIRFLPDGRLGAEAGCNSLGGEYSLDGSRLEVTSLTQTEIGCEPALHAQDEWIADLLRSGPDLASDGTTLTLTSGATTVTLDQDTPTAAVDLVGSTWTVDALVADETASSVPQGVEATIVFSGDGAYAVNTGCNTGSGGVEVGDGTLQMDLPTLTRMRCGPEATQVEQAVLQVLQGDVAYAITGDRLTLTVADRGIELVAR